MPVSVLVKKLKLEPGFRAAIIHAPEGYLASLSPLPEDVELSDHLEGIFDWVQVFVRNKEELDRIVPMVISALKPESRLWLTFPKGTSKIQNDLTRDKGWEAIQSTNLKWINLVSVDDNWSAFSLRLYKLGEKRQSFR
jgi:hypothetical protein